MSLPPAAIPASGGSGPLSFLEFVALHVCHSFRTEHALFSIVGCILGV